MRHSKNLDQVLYKDFIRALDPDYSYIDDKKSIWEKKQPYEPSSDEESTPKKSEGKLKKQ